MESKKKKLLISGIIFISIGILLISIPFPVAENVIERENSTLPPDVALPTHFETPWRSFNQIVHVNIHIFNGNYSFLILNEINFINWINNLSFESYFQESNLTEVKTTIFINPPYLGELTFLFITFSPLNYSAYIEIEYFNYLTNWGGLSVIIGLILIIDLVLLKWKQRRFKQH